MAVPVYDAALAGYLAWAIGMPALIMTLGLIVVGVFGHDSALVTLANFLPSFAIFVLAVALGEVVRGRRALAAETARRLRLAEDERRSETARLVAEERLRIARELHDTVAHSMATITVQAGSAIHLLAKPSKSLIWNGSSRLPEPPAASPDIENLQDALLAIRETSKSALAEMRAVLGQLRGPGDPGDAGDPPVAGDGVLGLSRLPELRAAVTAAGSPVTVMVEGEQAALPPPADHAAYRILQESLTNVLRHAAPGTPATVRLCYEPERLTITVVNVADAGRAADAGSAGVPASVGVPGSAGVPGSVGVPGNGGVPGSAGVPGNGGVPSSAGVAGNGGATSNGGAMSSGGATADGRATANGGAMGNGNGNGIRGMRERAASVGGTLEAGPALGGGFAVTATIPRAAS
jgi:signal transduction histidine kinase